MALSFLKIENKRLKNYLQVVTNSQICHNLTKECIANHKLNLFMRDNADKFNIAVTSSNAFSRVG